MPPVEVKEIVYQAVPYVGMGKVFDFIHVTNEVLQSRGVELPVQGQSTTSPGTRFGYPRTLNAIRVINDGTSA